MLLPLWPFGGGAPPSGDHTPGKITRLSVDGYGARRATFTAKGDQPAGPHVPGILTRLSLDGYGAKRAGGFAGKQQESDAFDCPNGVRFDGTSDFVARGGDLDGIADGSQGSIFAWVRFNSAGDGLLQNVFTTTPGRLVFRKDSVTNILRIAPSDAALNSLVLNSNAPILGSDDWLPIMASWDTDFAAGSKLAHLYIGDTDVLDVTDASPAFDIPYQSIVTDWQAGAGNSGNLLNGDIAVIWFSTGYIDFSIIGNRRKFINALGQAVDLGSNGQLPTGVAPLVYLRGPAADFATNLGTGGDFSVTGTLTESTDDPPCSQVEEPTEGAFVRAPLTRLHAGAMLH